MRKFRLRCLMLASSVILLSSGTINMGAVAQAPMNNSNVSMMLLRVVKNNGQKYIETQTGEFLPITGEHIARDATAVAIYRDGNNNYWFIDKSGQPMSIPPEKVQWAMNSIAQQREAKQAGAMAPNGYPNQQYSGAPPQQTTIINQGSGSTGSSGMGMVGTGLAAAGGAMAGSLIGDAINDNGHYYGIPYGAPIYHDGAGQPYYKNGSGSNVYVNNKHNNNVMNQWNQQGDWDNRNNWSPANNAQANNWKPSNNPQANNWKPSNNPTAQGNANNLAQNQSGQKQSRRERRQQEHNGGAAKSGEGFGGSHEGWGGFSGGKLDGGGGRRFGGRRR